MEIPCYYINDCKRIDYILNKLREFGYSVENVNRNITGCLVLDYLDIFGKVEILLYDCCKIGRYLINDETEFLKEAERLMNKNSNIIKINGIEIKPGMVIIGTDCHNKNQIEVAFPVKDGIGFISYTEKNSWNYNKLCNIIDITEIRDISKNQVLTDGEILWSKPNYVEITMDEIAEKFNVNVEQLKIKK